MWQGAVLVAFCAGIIGSVDNILRPLLVGKDTKLPDYVVLISTLGGMAIFGISGFVIGPMVAALFNAAWELFAPPTRRRRCGGRPARQAAAGRQPIRHPEVIPPQKHQGPTPASRGVGPFPFTSGDHSG